MLSISLGPLALPVAPLMLIVAVWGQSALASRLAGRAAQPGTAALASQAVFNAAAWGLLAARCVYLGFHADLYLATPGSALDVRDGGWNVPAGVLTFLVWLGWRAWRVPVLRQPLAVSSLVAGLCVSVFVLGRSWGPAPSLPAMALTSLDTAGPVTLPQAARGRPVVVNLWASWCGPCRQEMPLLAAAQRAESVVAVVLVNQGESEAAVRAYLGQQGLPLQDVLLDSGSKLGAVVGSRGLPTTLFYDAQGRQVDAHVGMLNAAALESRLRTLRAPDRTSSP